MLRFVRTAFFLALVVLTSACRTTKQTSYMHPNADLGALKTVAVLPFDSVVADRTAAEKIQKIFLIELLSLETFDVVEPGLVKQAIRTERIEAADALTPADVMKLGKALTADAVFTGSVVDFAESRTGTLTSPQVTVQLRLVETATGRTIWSTSQTRSGATVSNRLFGVGGETLTDAARTVIRQQLATLFK